MKFRKNYSSAVRVNIRSPLDFCVNCESDLKTLYTTGRKHVISLNGLIRVTYSVKTCVNKSCELYNIPVKGPPLSPKYCQYGFDVVFRVGWLRFHRKETLGTIYEDLKQFGIKTTRWEIRKLADIYQKLIGHEVRGTELQKPGERNVILSVTSYKPIREEGREDTFSVFYDCLGKKLIAVKRFENLFEELPSFLRGIIPRMKVRAVVCENVDPILRTVRSVFTEVPVLSFDFLSKMREVKRKRMVAGRTEKFLGNPKVSADVQIHVENGAVGTQTIERYRKKIDKLLSEIKIRDEKIQEQKRKIEKLEHRLRFLEHQVHSLLTCDSTFGKTFKIERENLTEFMWRITSILKSDPKYKLVYFLNREGKSDICKLSHHLGVPLERLNSLLGELEAMNIVEKAGKTVLLKNLK
nr:hypothetical protein [Candidatus Freyarchaeota archaeon]